jgi:hypothetical protein
MGSSVWFKTPFVAVVHVPEKRGIHLESVHREETGKTMDVLMNIRRRLCEEFFPVGLGILKLTDGMGIRKFMIMHA